MRRNITVRTVMLNNAPLAARRRAQADIVAWLREAPRLHRIAGPSRLAETAAAHEAVEAGGKRGTVVVLPAAKEGAGHERDACWWRSGRTASRSSRLNRPESRNPLDPEVQDALVAAVLRLDADPAVRVMILTGAGSAFSAGGNVRRMGAASSGPDGAHAGGGAALLPARHPAHTPWPSSGWSCRSSPR